MFSDDNIIIYGYGDFCHVTTKENLLLLPMVYIYFDRQAKWCVEK
jgi:hypothetical protein